MIDGKNYDINRTQCLLTDKGRAWLEIVAFADIACDPPDTYYTNKPLAYAFALYACSNDYPSKALKAITTNRPPLLSGIQVCLGQRPVTSINGRIRGQQYNFDVFPITNINSQQSTAPLPTAPAGPSEGAR